MLLINLFLIKHLQNVDTGCICTIFIMFLIYFLAFALTVQYPLVATKARLNLWFRQSQHAIKDQEK